MAERIKYLRNSLISLLVAVSIPIVAAATMDEKYWRLFNYITWASSAVGGSSAIYNILRYGRK